MPRRKTKNITKIRGTGHVDYTEVWRIFECFNPECDNLMKFSEDELDTLRAEDQPVLVKCTNCGYENTEDILSRAQRWKYCRVCEWLQPLENFHRHAPNSSSFRSGRQLECAFCKNTRINPHLNPLRTADQHRESSERRRLYAILSNEKKINSQKVYDLFEGKCFNCGKRLEKKAGSSSGYHLDHTLPARLFWPLSLGPTLLCTTCNNNKHEKWPSNFYGEQKIRQLSVLTGIPYVLLKGEPIPNPEAVAWLKTNIDEFLARWIRYPDEIKRIHELILDKTGEDIYKNARTIPEFLKEENSN